MKKVFMIIISLVLIFGLSSCNEYEDLMPNYEDYAVWDGNYIYKGNYRSKTTGEGEEQLIENIVYEDIIYNIDSYNYAIYNKNIYFIFKAYGEVTEFNAYGSKEYIFSTFFVKYNIYEKSYTVLHAFLNEELILYFDCFYEDYIYLRKYNDSNNLEDYFVYDVNNSKLIVLEDISYSKTFEEELFICKDKTLYYIKTSDFIFNKIMTLTTRVASIDKVANSDKYRIIFRDTQNTSLGYFNTTTFEYKGLLSSNSEKTIKFINEDYFLICETKEYEYYIDKFDTITKELKVNNKLYKVNLEEITYELVYEFENKDADYTKGIIIDNVYYMNQTIVRKGIPFFPGGAKTKGYKLNLETFKLSRNFKKISLGKEVEDDSVVYEALVYYIDNDSFGALMGRKKVYYLYCKDTSCDQVYLMQFFVYYGDEVHLNYQGTRSAYNMWMDSLDFTNETVIVLDY